MENSTRELIEFNQGWEYIEKGITKLKRILQGLPEPQFSSEDYISLYSTVYAMCRQKPPHDYSQQLYDKYREVFLDYLTSTVLPSLENTQHADEKCWLRDIVKEWKNHKIMVRWLSRFFHYLDRLFVCQRALPSTNAVGMICFRDLVYGNVKGKVRDVVISLIGIEREGEEIDQDLVKNAIDMFVEMGVGQLKCYKDDFEVAMLDDTSAYYSRKASNWIVEDSRQEYMLKAEECLKQEKIRCGNYLHASSEKKLLDKVQNAFASKLLEKGDSGGLEETRQKINKLHLGAGESADT